MRLAVVAVLGMLPLLAACEHWLLWDEEPAGITASTDAEPAADASAAVPDSGAVAENFADSINGTGLPPGAIMLAPTPPPRAMNDKQPYPNNAPSTLIWQTGFWWYDGEAWQWQGGEYVARPHPTAVWSPARWEERAYGWAFVPGYWQ